MANSKTGVRGEKDSATETTCEILIIGAGISGIGIGIHLLKSGFSDFVILERSDEVGGTWRDNTYPGLTVDVPTLSYSYSFEMKPDWSNLLAPRDEIFEYLKDCTYKYGVRDHIRFGEDVTETAYDSKNNVWTTCTASGGAYVSKYVINASGFLNTPRWPDIDGFETFEGTKVHSSQWSDDIPLEGKRVAVIGTGATSIQLAPEIAPSVQKLSVFQRTPIWLLPKPDMSLPAGVQRAFKVIPGLQRSLRLLSAVFMEFVFYRYFIKHRQLRAVGRLAERIGRRQIRKQVNDPATQEALTPSYRWGCKRPSYSNDYFPMFNRDNVELVTASIECMKPNGIVTNDGVERPIDVVICATGYQPFSKAALPTYQVRGRDGIDLWEYWEENRYQAFRGIAINGFPNFFLVFGPYSVSGVSYVNMVQTAARRIIRCLKSVKARDGDYIDVKEGAQRDEFRRIVEKKSKSIFSVADCVSSNTYYYDRFGDTPSFRPSNLLLEWLDSRTLNVNKYFEIKRVNGRKGDEPLSTNGSRAKGVDAEAS